MEASLCIPFDHYELESDIFLGVAAPVRRKKYQRIEQSSDDAGKERAGSAEATAQQIQTKRSSGSFDPQPPWRSQPAKVQKRKKAKVKTTRRANPNP